MQLDNSTLRSKVSLRLRLLKEIESPVIMETHGGYGRVFLDCYGDIENGCVFEKDPAKADALARQRPTWAVYECDVIGALMDGVGKHLEINFLDVDPYGDPWPVLDAFYGSERPRGPIIAVAVNDGLRQKLKMSGGWDVESMSSLVSRYGNAVLYKRYKELCAELMEEKAAQAGYRLDRWTAYYAGHANQMTHYGAILRKVQ